MPRQEGKPARGRRACRGPSADRVVTFEHALIERPLDGDKIEATKDQGWSWYELDAIDPKAGGSTRAEVDALRLMAILLAHWDNKGANQKLLCPAGTVAARRILRARRSRRSAISAARSVRREWT